MCHADVTRSQRSPGFGWTSAAVKAAFSYVLRERFSRISRVRGTPMTSACRLMTSASATPPPMKPLPPEKTRRAPGKRRASSAS
jgi:hypothetical protein